MGKAKAAYSLKWQAGTRWYFGTFDEKWLHDVCVSSAGIIAVVIFTILCTLVFLIRYMFRHKGTYHTNEAKGSGESARESADTAIIGTDNPETIDESKKEWFI